MEMRSAWAEQRCVSEVLRLLAFTRGSSIKPTDSSHQAELGRNLGSPLLEGTHIMVGIDASSEQSLFLFL